MKAINILEIPEGIWQMYDMETRAGKLMIKKPSLVLIPLIGYEVRESRMTFEFVKENEVKVVINKGNLHIGVSL